MSWPLSASRCSRPPANGGSFAANALRPRPVMRAVFSHEQAAGGHAFQSSDDPWSVRPSINPRSSTRSANRNGHRPAAIATNGSGSAASVHPTGSENCLHCESRKNTRSSDHVCRTARNTNSRPNHSMERMRHPDGSLITTDRAQLTTWNNALAETVIGYYKTELIRGPRRRRRGKPSRTLVLERNDEFGGATTYPHGRLTTKGSLHETVDFSDPLDPKKVAVVTDSHLGDVAERLASHFVSAEIRHFPAGQI